MDNSILCGCGKSRNFHVFFLLSDSVHSPSTHTRWSRKYSEELMKLLTYPSKNLPIQCIKSLMERGTSIALMKKSAISDPRKFCWTKIKDESSSLITSPHLTNQLDWKKLSTSKNEYFWVHIFFDIYSAIITQGLTEIKPNSRY